MPLAMIKHSNSYPIRARASHKGFTLLEVLIAIVVLSVGLLGLAGLQATGLRNNHQATLLTSATLQAYDMADRMRANKAAIDSYLFTASPTAPTCTTCTAAQIAALDGSQWYTANSILLPSGSGSVTKPAGSNVYTITVTWTDTKPQSFSTSFQP